MGPLISRGGGTFCFGLQVEICGPAEGIFRGTEYYVTDRIRSHFRARPGTYTQQELLSWEAYNYFQSGYVREVLSMPFGHGSSRCVVLKAKVNPSLRSPDNAHEPWIIARLDGHILCAHCTCKAG